MKWKSSTLDDLESQYCNRNCIGCSPFSLATAGLSCYTVQLCWKIYVTAPHFYQTVPDQVWNGGVCCYSMVDIMPCSGNHRTHHTSDWHYPSHHYVDLGAVWGNALLWWWGWMVWQMHHLPHSHRMDSGWYAALAHANCLLIDRIILVIDGKCWNLGVKFVTPSQNDVTFIVWTVKYEYIIVEAWMPLPAFLKSQIWQALGF